MDKLTRAIGFFYVDPPRVSRFLFKNNLLNALLIETNWLYLLYNLKTNNMWLQSVFNAISEVETNRPGLVNKIAKLDPNEEWDQKTWEDYSYVAAAIVEPFVFPGGESEDEDFYYSKCDSEGYGMVQGNIGDIPNSEDWRIVCSLIEIQGY